nr:MAG TPA: hypothetical protein [Caudoviricetes sp.]
MPDSHNYIQNYDRDNNSIYLSVLMLQAYEEAR